MYAPTFNPDLSRRETTANREEFTLLAHVRGWCHDSTACGLCQAQDRALKAERTLDQIISG